MYVYFSRPHIIDEFADFFVFGFYRQMDGMGVVCVMFLGQFIDLFYIKSFL